MMTIKIEKKLKLVFAVIICLTVFFIPLQADTFHYKEALIGERASGLAGAFSAVSDDPSGAFYNPAGLAFAQNDYISISTNSFKYSELTSNKIVGDSKDWTMFSNNFFPSFFGLLQDFNGIKLGFSIITPESERIDQDTRTELDYSQTSTRNQTWVRNYNVTTQTYLVGPSIGLLINPNFSIGMSVFAMQRSRSVIDNQWIDWKNRDNIWHWENKYIEENGLGVLPIVGLQFMPVPEVSVGARLKTPYIIKADAVVESINKHVSVTTSVSEQKTYNLKSQGYIYQPLSMNLGVAWFASSKLLLTTDVDYYHSHYASNEFFKKKPIVNISSGMEYFFNRNISLRGGLYSNNSNVHTVFSSVDDIDMIGVTTSLGYETEFSSISIGLDFSFGEGKTYLNDLNNPFDSTYKSYYLFFSGSYRL